MKAETREQRRNRVIARGEHSGHSHIVTGDVEIGNLLGTNRKVVIVNENSNAALKHLLEEPYLNNGQEIWTQEHKDIALPPGTYEFIIQEEYDLYKDAPRQVID